MYMDRQALAQQTTEITGELELSNEDYGRLETGFGLAFAVGGIVTGLIADRISPRWLYPVVLLGWSAVGFATGWVTSYRELLVCRVLLGFFEAGHWPCALVTAQRLLSRRDRPLGNSILQSGASLGAIATPIVVLALEPATRPRAGGCRSASSARSACSGSSPGSPRSALADLELDADRAGAGLAPRTSRPATRTARRRRPAISSGSWTLRPPVPGPGGRRDHDQPLLAVLPGLDARDAPRAVRLQPASRSSTSPSPITWPPTSAASRSGSWSSGWRLAASRSTGRGWRRSWPARS